MKEYEELNTIVDRLLGPGGCPWDREQTMKSIRSNIIEESAELVEAIDTEDNAHIREELGDIFFLAIFFCKLAEKEGRCTTKEVLQEINEKLIRRHPHVFGEAKIADSDAALKQWGEIKQTEKSKAHRKSALDSIPKGLPALARAQKVHKKLHDANYPDIPKIKEEQIKDEESLGKALFRLVAQAQEKGLDAEHALRKILVSLESQFRKHELLTNR